MHLRIEAAMGSRPLLDIHFVQLLVSSVNNISKFPCLCLFIQTFLPFDWLNIDRLDNRRCLMCGAGSQWQCIVLLSCDIVSSWERSLRTAGKHSDEDASDRWSIVGGISSASQSSRSALCQLSVAIDSVCWLVQEGLLNRYSKRGLPEEKISLSIVVGPLVSNIQIMVF